MFRTLIGVLLIVHSLHGMGQEKVSFFFASRPCRDSVTEKLRQQVEQTIALPLQDSTYIKWKGTFWAMELMLYRPQGYAKKIPGQLSMLPSTNADFQRSFMEMLFTLYPGTFAKQVRDLWNQFSTDKVKAIALEYLAASGIFPELKAADSFIHSPYHNAFLQNRKKIKPQLPVKKVFLDNSFLPGGVVVCSFQSINRNKPGYLMIRNEMGEWLTDSARKPYRFPQLARSITNLPYYLTNGNTPQGLYRIAGFDTSNNNWIGPTTNLQMVLPFENENYFFGTANAESSFYRNLLGPALNNYPGLWESFTAGKLGRSEIIVHGTTIDPGYYKNEKYYPLTPSLGCLCSPEIWDDKGERTYSAQAEWIKIFQTMKRQPLYLIVAEVKDL